MDSPPKQPWSVEFDVPAGDDIQEQFNAEWQRYAPKWTAHVSRLQRKHRINTLSAAVCTTLGMILIVISPQALSMANGLGALQIMLCSIGVLSLVAMIDSSRSLRAARDPKPAKSKPAVSQPAWTYHLRVSDAGVLFSLTHYDSLLRWTMYYGVISLPSFVVLQSVAENSAIIHNSCFTSDVAREDFITCVRGLIAANGATVEDRVRAYLRDHSMPCPKCRYELKGNQTGACPECGLALTLENVPHARDPSLISRN